MAKVPVFQAPTITQQAMPAVAPEPKRDAMRPYKLGQAIMQAVREGRYADAAMAWDASTLDAVESAFGRKRVAK